MANTKSAKKSVEQNQKRRLKNIARTTAIKTAIKKVMSAMSDKAPVTDVEVLLGDVAAKLARAKSKKVMHCNTASRKLSRLAKKVSGYKKAQ